MTQRRLDASRVLERMSTVRELRAAIALDSAVREERERRHVLEEVEAACNVLAVADGACLAVGHRVDTARYDMLSQLGVALAQQHERAAGALDEATEQRSARAMDSFQAKRQREQVGERVAELNQARCREQADRLAEDAVELWLRHRETP